MKCELCGGELKKRLISYTLFYEGHWVIVEHVPAKECLQCGEKLFDPEVVEKLQNIIWNKRKADRRVEMPVFDLAGKK